MINREEPYLVKIIDLFHRLAKTEAQVAIARPDAGALDSYVLSWVGKVGLARSDPVADDRRPNHIRYKFKFSAVPSEQYGTRAAAAVDFIDALSAARGPFDLILYDACGPEPARHLGLRGVAESGQHLGRAL